MNKFIFNDLELNIVHGDITTVEGDAYMSEACRSRFAPNGATALLHAKYPEALYEYKQRLEAVISQDKMLPWGEIICEKTADNKHLLHTVIRGMSRTRTEWASRQILTSLLLALHKCSAMNVQHLVIPPLGADVRYSSINYALSAGTIMFALDLYSKLADSLKNNSQPQTVKSVTVTIPDVDGCTLFLDGCYSYVENNQR